MTATPVIYLWFLHLCFDSVINSITISSKTLCICFSYPSLSLSRRQNGQPCLSTVVAMKDHLSGMTFHDLVLKRWGESFWSVLYGCKLLYTVRAVVETWERKMHCEHKHSIERLILLGIDPLIAKCTEPFRLEETHLFIF